MPTFKNLNDLMKYVKKATSDSIPELGKELEEIMKEEIQTQVYDAYKDNEWRTGQLKESVETTHISEDRVEVSWRDNGDWNSVINGNHMYVIHGLEMGKTWGEGGYRPSTNLVEESYKRAEDEIPNKYKIEMKKRGIPIK